MVVGNQAQLDTGSGLDKVALEGFWSRNYAQCLRLVLAHLLFYLHLFIYV